MNVPVEKIRMLLEATRDPVSLDSPVGDDGGATVGDFLDKPVSDGGLALSRPLASAVIAVFIVVCVLVLPQRAGTHRRTPKSEPGLVSE